MDVERPPQGRDDLGWLAHPLGVEAEGTYHLRHIHLVGPPGGSTLTTSAPRPASVSPQYSACSSASSMTRMPVSGPRLGTGVEAVASSCAAMVSAAYLASTSRMRANAEPYTWSGRSTIATRLS